MPMKRCVLQELHAHIRILSATKQQEEQNSRRLAVLMQIMSPFFHSQDYWEDQWIIRPAFLKWISVRSILRIIHTQTPPLPINWLCMLPCTVLCKWLRTFPKIITGFLMPFSLSKMLPLTGRTVNTSKQNPAIILLLRVKPKEPVNGFWEA